MTNKELELMPIRQRMRENEKIYMEEVKQQEEKQKKIDDERKKFQKSWKEAKKARRESMKKECGSKIYSRKNKPPKEYFTELNSGEIRVETAGYLPLAEKIRRFEKAGINLEERMQELYDFSPQDKNKDGFEDELIKMWPDKIEQFEIVKNLRVKALQAVLNEEMEDYIKEKENEAEKQEAGTEGDSESEEMEEEKPSGKDEDGKKDKK